MNFLIYAELDAGEKQYTVDKEIRDQGIVGWVTTQKLPIAQASTKAAAIERAYSLLGRHRSGFYSVTDAEGNLFETVFDMEYSRLEDQVRYWRFQAVALLLIGAFSGLVAARTDPPWAGLLVFLSLAATEFALSRIYNFVEGTIAFLILMTLLGLFFGKQLDRDSPKVKPLPPAPVSAAPDAAHSP